MLNKILIAIISLLLATAVTATVLGFVFHDNDGGAPEGGTTEGAGDTSSGNGTGGGTGNGGSGSADGGDGHVCSFVFTAEEQAGCLTQGYKLYTCACGKTDKRDYTPHLGHDFSWTVTKVATCTEDGTETGTCKRCSAVSTKVNTASHSYGAFVANNDATCLKEGTQTATCTKCGGKKTQTIPNSTRPHAFGAYISNNDATCQQDGTETSTCPMCGDKRTRTVANSKLSHNFVTVKSNNDATCTKDATEEAECFHCGTAVTRTVANTKLGHSYGAYISNNDATCSTAGTKTATCSRCGSKDTVKDPSTANGAHSYGSWTSVAGTCTTEGYRKQTCKNCGYVNQISTGKADHTISGNKCTVCNETFQNKTGTFALDIKNSDGQSSFGSVSIEFNVISVSNYVMTFEMYVVQKYTLNGQNKQTRTKVEIPRPDDKNVGSYTVKFYSLIDNSEISFSGWIDYDVHETERWVTFIIGGSGSAGGNSYLFNQRYYITF